MNSYDFIIIGSGFGGSVSALRLTEKGYRVLVIERGKRFRDKDFPRSNWNLRKYLWLPPLKLYGIQNITFLRDVLVLHGTGVGGGSLVYANTHLEPPSTVFDDPRWTDKNWHHRLQPFYRLAKKMLGTTRAPHLAESDRLLKQVAQQMGREDTFYHVDVGVYFGEPEQTAPDPYFDGMGPERMGCKLCGSCMTGCRHNAKNTLDKNYLYLAEKQGATILPETEVLGILPSGRGYRVLTRKSTGFLHTKGEFSAPNVVLSAGVLGTVKLLKKCNENGWLPKLSPMLGDYVRTNSEAILGVRVPKKMRLDLNRGIAISAGFHPDDETHIETVRFGKHHDAMGFLTMPMTTRDTRLPGILQWIIEFFKRPLSFLRAMNPLGWAASTVILLVMQPVSNYLKLQYKRRWWRLGGFSLNSRRNTPEKIPSFIPSGEKATRMMAKNNGGVPLTSVADTLLNIPTTAHILGGCIMGKDESSGVVDEDFQVFNYPGLYVVDGSVIPANLGVNPSLTITAMAEYAMSRVGEKE